MRIGDFQRAELHRLLKAGNLLVDFGPLVVRIEVDEPGFTDAFRSLYGAFPAPSPKKSVPDITLQLRRSGPGTSLWLADGRPAGESEPFAVDQFLPQFEWAAHFAIATALAPSIAFHAAVASDESGKAVALVGASGSGKSTLVAGMVASGWRLVADEFLVITPDGRVAPLPGLITLKRDSIEVVRALRGGLNIGPVTVHPGRGPIAHATAPDVVGQGEDIRIATIVFPIFEAGATMKLTDFAPTSSFQYLKTQSHNLHVLGSSGFKLLCELSRVPAAELSFGDLESGLAGVQQMLERAP